MNPNNTAPDQANAQPGQTDWFGDSSGRANLRIRYRPPCRIHSVFFSVVPWLNIFLLVMAFVLLMQSRAVVPGFNVDLPVERTGDGMRSSLIIVAKNIPHTRSAEAPAASPGNDGAVEPTMNLMLFFKDDRFNMSKPHSIATFRNNLMAAMRGQDETEVILYLDETATQKDAIRLAAMLRDAGVTRICHAVRQKEE